MDDDEDNEEDADEADDVLAIPDVRRTQKKEEIHSAVSALQNVSVLQSRWKIEYKSQNILTKHFNVYKDEGLMSWLAEADITKALSQCPPLDMWDWVHC